jgi:hypothetical protein
MADYLHFSLRVGPNPRSLRLVSLCSLAGPQALLIEHRSSSRRHPSTADFHALLPFSFYVRP